MEKHIEIQKSKAERHILQIQAQDGYIYLYDADTKSIKKLRDIVRSCEIPNEVWETLKCAKLEVSGLKTES